MIQAVKNFEIVITVDDCPPTRVKFPHDEGASKTVYVDANDVCHGVAHIINTHLRERLERKYDVPNPIDVYAAADYGNVFMAERRARWARWRIAENKYESWDTTTTRRKDQALLRRLEKRIAAEAV